LAHKSKGIDLQPGNASNIAETRTSKLATLMDMSTKESSLSSALAASGMGDRIVHPVEKEITKFSELNSGYGGDGSWGQSTVSAGSSRIDAPSFVATPSMPSPETAVADTVNYWVTQGVQNAQLKLDGFGGEPVEVSISLKGDEAHIDFRSDQPEIRQILEGAVSHLSDLLVSEGLVLSGVSIGASGQDGAGGGQEQRSRPGARQTTIVSTEMTQMVGRRQINPLVGRALDLFV
jgi:flagellar hook-length control protein FliK